MFQYLIIAWMLIRIEFERYEGQEISKFVEITDYREYNLAERGPDVIFIHNPYDQYNSVTQLPKDYFSSELIKYTNHLVYFQVCFGKSYIGYHDNYAGNKEFVENDCAIRDTQTAAYPKWNERESDSGSRQPQI